MIEIVRGTTVDVPIRVESTKMLYLPSDSVVSLAPLRVKIKNHPIPDGWRCAISGTIGLDQANAKSNPPRDNELRRVTVIDADIIEFNDINASEFEHYCSGGHVALWEPMNLSDYVSASMVVLDKIGGSVISTYALVIDMLSVALRLQMSDEQSAAVAYDTGIFSVRAETAGGRVDPLNTLGQRIRFL